MHLWKKTVALYRAETWAEQVAATVGLARLAEVNAAGGRTTRLEVYCATAREAHALARRFGGQVRPVRAETWQPSPATAPGRPLAIGVRLWVTGRAEELPSLRTAHPDRGVLCIPAAMAFGTGEHATTAMCLRLLAEVARGLTRWRLLDLGSGSGILALAGRTFGAAGAVGLDNDPHAVRTARENAALNGLRKVRFQRADLLGDWPVAVGGAEWPVVTANLFSELLIALLPRIRAALADDGTLIASGVLASQAEDVEAAFAKNGLALVTKRRRGKWTAFGVRRHDAALSSGNRLPPASGSAGLKSGRPKAEPEGDMSP